MASDNMDDAGHQVTLNKKVGETVGKNVVRSNCTSNQVSLVTTSLTRRMLAFVLFLKNIYWPI